MPKNTVQESRLYANEQGALVEVSSSVDAPVIEFCAQGGGWIRSLPREEFEKRYTPADKPAFKAVTVTGDWLPEGVTLPAYSTGLRWNGWSMPSFTFEAAMQVIAHMPSVRYDPQTDSFISRTEDYPEDECEESFGPSTISVNGEDIKVYALGTGCWTWEDEADTHSPM